MTNRGDDDGPDSLVSVDIGVCGIVIFFCLLTLSLLALASSIKHKYSKLIFGFASAMCIFEFPRCIALVVEEQYRDQATYILHMIANVFFFMSFTFVCLLLHEAVDLSKTTSPLRTKIVFRQSTIESMLLTKNSLYATNIVFAIIVFITSIFCGTAPSLFDYFRHDVTYKIYTYFDIIKNLVYSAALLYFGCKLRSRIKGFSKQVTVHQDSSVQETLILHRLEFAVRKLIIVMAVCIFSFTLRSIMLIMKVVVVEEDMADLPGFEVYGLLWFWFSDYLPRTLPVLAFIYFLGNITPPKAFLFRFRLFSKESNLENNQANNLHDSNSLSQSIASTLYEEEYSMNQITPALRDFFMSEAAAIHRPSMESEGSFYGGGTGTMNTTGGGTGARTSSVDTSALSTNRNSSKEKNPPPMNGTPPGIRDSTSSGRSISTPLGKAYPKSLVATGSHPAHPQRKSAPSVASNPMHNSEQQALTNPVSEVNSVVNDGTGSQKGTQPSSGASNHDQYPYNDNQSVASFPREQSETDGGSNFWG